MMKKLLAAFLSALMLLGVCAVFAVADDPADEPDYRVTKDPDFTNVVSYTEGNDKATILHPGDVVFFQKGGNTSFTYYPDVDANASGAWVPDDAGLLAFSLSAKTSLTDSVPSATFVSNGNKYTVLGLDQAVNAGTPNEAAFDFTIRYPEKNTFIGWVIYSYEMTDTLNKIVLYGLWDKTYNDVNTEDEPDEDLSTILDTHATWLQKLTAPFLAYNKQLVNSILDYLQAALDKMTGSETQDNGDIGVYQASIKSFKIAMEIFARWLDSWATPIVELFD